MRDALWRLPGTDIVVDQIRGGTVHKSIDSRRKRCFNQAGHRQMRDHHGGNGDRQVIGAVKSVAHAVREQQGLDPEFHGRAESGRVDSDIRSDGRCRAAGPGSGLFTAAESACDQLVNKVSKIRQDKGHIKAVGAESENTAVTEDQRLQEQGGRDSYTGRIRTEKQGGQCSAHSVSGRSSYQGNVEHHGKK